MKGRKIKYSTEELEWVQCNRFLPRSEAHEKFCNKFKRSDVSLNNYNALCKRKKWFTGRTGCFAKGQQAWNEGKKMPFNANTAKTQFKPGQQPHNTKYLGHERLSKNGYIEISVAQTNPNTGFSRRYVLKHRWLWEEKHGALPDGMCLKCLDGNKTNTDPSNWSAIPRAMLPRLNGNSGRNYDQSQSELKPLIMTTVQLEHLAREKRKQAENCSVT